jgi:hypothetical protein
MVTIDHKKQAGLTIQTPVTDLEAILARYIHHYTAVSNVFKKKTGQYDSVPTSNLFQITCLWTSGTFVYFHTPVYIYILCK